MGARSGSATDRSCASYASAPAREVGTANGITSSGRRLIAYPRRMSDIPQLVAVIDSRLADIAAETVALEAARAELAAPPAIRRGEPEPVKTAQDVGSTLAPKRSTRQRRATVTRSRRGGRAVGAETLERLLARELHRIEREGDRPAGRCRLRPHPEAIARTRGGRAGPPVGIAPLNGVAADHRRGANRRARRRARAPDERSEPAPRDVQGLLASPIEDPSRLDKADVTASRGARQWWSCPAIRFAIGDPSPVASS